MAAKVNQDECLGCGACTGVCPVEAIKLNDAGLAEVDADACLDCGACEGTCPVSAISLG